MKIVHIGHNNFDGAGRAMHRLHQALAGSGFDSHVLVYAKQGDPPAVEGICPNAPLNWLQKKFPRLAYYNQFHTQNRYWNMVHRWRPTSLFNNNEPCLPTSKLLGRLQGVDVLCLHSIQQTVSPEQLRIVQQKLGIPIVWTLLDMEPITGGCHFNNRCEKYMQQCAECPQLENRSPNDWSALNWNRKQQAYEGMDITFVAVTQQSKEYIQQSALHGARNVALIPLSVGPAYRPAPMADARRSLNIDPERKVLVFGCFNLADERKGGHLLLEALEKLSQTRDISGMTLLTFGEANEFSADHLPLDWHHLGRLHGDQAIARAYGAANVFTCPSIDDIGPMMINEAFMCGKPVVAFDTGVASDLVPLHPAGYLVRYKDTDDYAAGIEHALYGPHAGSTCPSDEVLALCLPQTQAAGYAALFDQLATRRTHGHG